MNPNSPPAQVQGVAILFLHHLANDITRQNLDSFKTANPGVPIHVITSGESFPESISLHDHPEASERWNKHISETWLKTGSSDLMIYLWYQFLRKPTEIAERWFIVEWDSYCNEKISHFAAQVWDMPVSGARTYWPSVFPDWANFANAQTLPSELHSCIAGISPFSFILVSNILLEKIVAQVPWDHLGSCRDEVRFATLCVAQGAVPAANPNAGPTITHKLLNIPFGLFDIPGMYHPLRTLYPYLSEQECPHKEDADLTTWSILEDDYHWLVQFAKREGIKRVIEFGPGDSTLAFLDAGCSILSYEHQPAFVLEAKKRFADSGNVEVRCCLANELPSYEADFQPDLIFVDGPPKRETGIKLSRFKQCHWAIQQCNLVILHDAHRSEEQATLEALAAMGFQIEIIPTQKGLAIIRSS